MKAIKLFSLLTLSLFLFAGCGSEDDTPTPEEIAEQLLTAEGSLTWTISGGNATKDGVSITSFYESFSITFTKSGSNLTYTTTGGGDLFDASGSWSFVGTEFEAIQLTGSRAAAGREIAISNSSTSLRLQFTVPQSGSGSFQTATIDGQYVFNLRPASN
ncbi:hypothetical protein [Penaeicola halotolerans]|uniref:hypothetical protein n=1 Tax=Penaeicola halotolerans TaxID=2793196 RepID=UPI001CF90B0D|nr:hypothetical protein [Penaeicola halotolerans]